MEGGDRVPPQGVVRFHRDTGKTTMSLPARNTRELRDPLEEWPAGMSTATVREDLVLARTLHLVVYVMRRGRGISYGRFCS